MKLRQLYLILLLYITLPAQAQQFGRIYLFATRKQAEEHFDKQLAAGKDKKTVLTSEKRSTPDSLRYKVTNEAECFNTNLGFTKDSVCNYQEYDFNCTACAKDHMFDMIRTYHMRRMSDIEYITPYYQHSKMVVQHFEPGNERLLLRFVPLEMSKKEYKALYRKLKYTPLT